MKSFLVTVRDVNLLLLTPNQLLIYQKDSVTELATLQDFETTIKSDKLTVVDFTANWCGPCRTIKPKYIALAEQSYFQNVNFCTCDVDANSETSAQQGVRAMPTFQFFRSGKKLDEMKGSDYDGLVRKVQEHM